MSIACRWQRQPRRSLSGRVGARSAPPQSRWAPWAGREGGARGATTACLCSCLLYTSPSPRD
eukprot:4746837-Alexandrium_andersonii.AAC.1